MTEPIRIRLARTSDVGAIKTLVAPLADQRILMAKETVAYYESLQEFRIAPTSLVRARRMRIGSVTAQSYWGWTSFRSGFGEVTSAQGRGGRDIDEACV